MSNDSHDDCDEDCEQCAYEREAFNYQVMLESRHFNTYERDVKAEF